MTIWKIKINREEKKQYIYKNLDEVLSFGYKGSPQ